MMVRLKPIQLIRKSRLVYGIGCPQRVFRSDRIEPSQYPFLAVARFAVFADAIASRSRATALGRRSAGGGDDVRMAPPTGWVTVTCADVNSSLDLHRWMFRSIKHVHFWGTFFQSAVTAK